MSSVYLVAESFQKLHEIYIEDYMVVLPTKKTNQPAKPSSSLEVHPFREACLPTPVLFISLVLAMKQGRWDAQVFFLGQLCYAQPFKGEGTMHFDKCVLKERNAPGRQDWSHIKSSFDKTVTETTSTPHVLQRFKLGYKPKWD